MTLRPATTVTIGCQPLLNTASATPVAVRHNAAENTIGLSGPGQRSRSRDRQNHPSIEDETGGDAEQPDDPDDDAGYPVTP